MVKTVEVMLRNEPELLTFYGTPVQTVKDSYVHIGVPQAPHNQSKVMSDYRIEKATDISYLLQGSTKHTLAGVSPLSNVHCLPPTYFLDAVASLVVTV